MVDQQPPRDTNAAPSFRSYVDTSGELGSKELGYGMWWVSHKAFFYRLLVALLAGFSVFTWIFSLWKGSLYGWYSFSKEPQLLAQMSMFTNYTALHPRFSPTPLQIIQTTVVPSGADKYDIVGEVANTNPWHVADFDYYFQVGSASTTLMHATLMPGEERPVAYLGYDAGAPEGSSALIIGNLTWKRLSNREVQNPRDYQAARLQFEVSDFSFIRAESNPGVTAHTIRFKIANNSPYSFKNPVFYVGLYVGDTLVGITPLELKDFRSLEKRSVDLRSFVQNLNVTDIRVYPLINIYDPGVYIKPGE